jgi:DMATS type aromatic prenyltransferase
MTKTIEDTQYWWRTTGGEIANMLRSANYPEATEHAFLSYYLNSICPLLGGAPDPSDPKQALSWTWDGSTHEYSFEFKKDESRPEVRFVLDACRLRPVDASNPLNPLPTDLLIETFASRAPGFDSTWYRALKRHFDYSHLPAEEQLRLGDKAGHLTPFLVGFDISRMLPAPPATLPVVGKAYFLPCFAAEAQRTTRFAVICAAIRDIPDIGARPNVLSSLSQIEDYLSTKPATWRDGARFLATDFLSPDKSRLKIYLRCPSTEFEDVWDYFTLGGRIPGLETDKERYRDFIDLLGGAAPSAAENGRDGKTMETDNRRKLTTLYFSMDNKSPLPSPKIAFCARNFAANDLEVARGLDSWFEKHGWAGDKRPSVEELVGKAFTHRGLDEKAGIFTFIGLARKNPTKPDLSIQTYLCPELYHSSRRELHM